jgi:hypothetical protein
MAPTFLENSGTPDVKCNILGRQATL